MWAYQLDGNIPGNNKILLMCYLLWDVHQSKTLKKIHLPHSLFTCNVSFQVVCGKHLSKKAGMTLTSLFQEGYESIFVGIG